MDLTSERQVGMAEGPIPWHSMLLWGRAYDLNAEEQQDLQIVMGMMDKAYLEYRASKVENS